MCIRDSSYGLAEKFLATWLHKTNPHDVVVGSKWGYTYVADWLVDAEVQEVKDHSVEAFRRQIAESQELLGSHLALYQIHSVTPESAALQDAQLLRELGALRDDGVAIGISTSGPGQVGSRPFACAATPANTSMAAPRTSRLSFPTPQLTCFGSVATTIRFLL